MLSGTAAAARSRVLSGIPHRVRRRDLARAPPVGKRLSLRLRRMGFSGWSPGAVEFFEGLQADNTKAYGSAHKAFCETSVR